MTTALNQNRQITDISRFFMSDPQAHVEPLVKLLTTGDRSSWPQALSELSTEKRDEIIDKFTRLYTACDRRQVLAGGRAVSMNEVRGAIFERLVFDLLNKHYYGRGCSCCSNRRVGIPNQIPESGTIDVAAWNLQNYVAEFYECKLDMEAPRRPDEHLTLETFDPIVRARRDFLKGPASDDSVTAALCSTTPSDIITEVLATKPLSQGGLEEVKREYSEIKFRDLSDLVMIFGT